MPNTPLPNMGLVPPSVGADRDQWGTELNSDLVLVDDHDHTTGKGVPVPTAGININADLSMNSNALTVIKQLQLNNLPSNPATGSNIIFFKAGDLYWKDGSLVSRKVDLAGILSLSNSANNLNIINLLDPISPQDAATKNYVDTHSSGTQDLHTTLSFGNSTDGYNIVVSTGDFVTLTDAPINPTDAANKAYVDAHASTLEEVLTEGGTSGAHDASFQQTLISSGALNLAGTWLDSSSVDIDNYALEANINVLLFVPGADINISGIVSTTLNGQVVMFVNHNDGYSITLLNNSLLSSLNNRFRLASNLVIPPRGAVILQKLEQDINFWTVYGGVGSSGGLQTLAETLAVGNTTDGYDLVLVSSDIKFSNTNHNVFINFNGDEDTGPGSNVTIEAQNTTDATDVGGSLVLSAGDGGGTGGEVEITGGDGTGTNANGGNVTITGGAPTGSGTKGIVTLDGITNIQSDYLITQPTGSGFTVGYTQVEGAGVGKNITIKAQTGQGGGKAIVQAGDADVSSDGNGGNIDLMPGAGDGIGTDGYIDANTSLIRNLLDPLSNQDAATKKYVDDNAGAAPLSTVLGIGNETGGTDVLVSVGDHIYFMNASGINQSVIGLSSGNLLVEAPNSQPGVNGTDLELAAGQKGAGAVRDGYVKVTRGQLDLVNKKIINVATPTVSTDAATKGYVDGYLSGGSQTLKQTLALGNVTDGYNLIQTASDYFDGSDGYTRVNQHLQVGGKVKLAEQSGLTVVQSGYAKVAALIASADGYQTAGRIAVLPNDGYGIRTFLTCNEEYHFFRTTTNATPTNALTLALADNTAYTLNYELIGNSISDGYVYRRVSQSNYHRINGGAAVQENTTVDSLNYASTGAAVLDASFSLSGNNLQLNLTGAISKTYKWSIIINYYTRPLLS